MSCTSTDGPGEAAREPAPAGALPPIAFFDYKPLDPATVHIQPEGGTVEQSWVLDLYTLFHARDYRALPSGHDRRNRSGADRHTCRSRTGMARFRW